MKIYIKPIQIKSTVHKVKQTNEYKKLTEEADKRIKENRLYYAQAYENAKNFIAI